MSKRRGSLQSWERPLLITIVAFLGMYSYTFCVWTGSLSSTPPDWLAVIWTPIATGVIVSYAESHLQSRFRVNSFVIALLAPPLVFFTTTVLVVGILELVDLTLNCAVPSPFCSIFFDYSQWPRRHRIPLFGVALLASAIQIPLLMMLRVSSSTKSVTG